jgi:hypothetical protein
MPEHKTNEYLGGALTGDARKNATNFFEYLIKSEIQLERGKGYWEDKRYWMAKFKGEYVCFILINGGEDITESMGWVIWLDGGGENWADNSVLDERTIEIAWRHVDICGNCGGCKSPGGSRKMIFGKEFDNVCITAIRFDNPDAETTACVKELVAFKKSEIPLTAQF